MFARDFFVFKKKKENETLKVDAFCLMETPYALRTNFR